MKVLIFGETCLDKFVYCKVERLNPEAPTPVVLPNKLNETYGMAGNVFNHFHHLGIEPTFITNKNTIIKTRYVDEKSNYILLRVDENDETKAITPSQLDKIDIQSYDLVLISDYNKGFLTEYAINRITRDAELCFIDTKKVIGKFVNDAFIKINKKEFDNNVLNGAKINRARLIVTMGDDGMKYNGMVYPTPKIASIDPVGAGDTALVFLSLFYYMTRDMGRAISEANYFAGLACSQRGVVSDFSKEYIDKMASFR
jgi:bifunctional ADP-heptose synthase (sugar kinase/adenylyltransferase)